MVLFVQNIKKIKFADKNTMTLTLAVRVNKALGSVHTGLLEMLLTLAMPKLFNGHC